MKKVILNLQWVISVFKIQDNQRTILNSVCWVFDQKAWFSKDLFQNWYLFDFISTIRLELTWSLKYEIWFQNKKDCRTMKNIEWVCEIFDMKWHQLFSILLEKLRHLEAIQWIMGRKTNSIQINWGQWKMIKWWINALRTTVFKEMLISRTSIQIIIGGNVVQKHSMI
jgi:hypothetical protein